MRCNFEERTADQRVGSKAFGASDEPEVQDVFADPNLRGQLRVETLGVVDQKAWVNVEKAREKDSRIVRQMAPSSPLDLGKVRLRE